MRKFLRWVIASLTAVGLFCLCLWLFQFAWFSWLPRDDADRWVVAGAFATVVATVVGAALGSWAEHSGRPEAPETGTLTVSKTRQTVGWAGRNARITQVGRDLHDRER